MPQILIWISLLVSWMGPAVTSFSLHHHIHHSENRFSLKSPPQKPLFLFTRWVGGGAIPEQPKDNPDSSSGVDQVMHSMQSFRANQRLGSMTTGILQELSGARVEGRSEDGKIRVVMNGQQYPVAVQVGDDVDMTTINSSLTQAMQDAHSKSSALMESKLKSLYEEIGLPNPAVKK